VSSSYYCVILLSLMSEQRRKRRSEVEIHGDILKFLEKTGEEDPGTGIQNKKLEFTPPSTIMSKKAPNIYPFTADITVQDFLNFILSIGISGNHREG